MEKIKEAKVRIDEYASFDNSKRYKIYKPIFCNDEIEKAEAIVKELDGLTIESARILLNKVCQYLEQQRIVL